MSMAPDYLVEVRDRNFAITGQIAPEFLNVQFTEVFRGVGAWQLKLPAEHPRLADLKAKGSGIVITQLSSGKVYSGRMRSAVLSQDAADPVGTWLVSGVDDNILGSVVAVLPDPAHAADAQATSYWILSGDGETVMKSAVQLNAGSTAIAARKYSWLSIATNAHRGATVKASERFKMLGEVLTSLGVAAGLGWRFYQSGAGIVFDVYQPADKTGLIQLDIRNGGLESTELGFSAPSATEVLVLGQGQGDDRTVRRVTSTAATAEAALWGLRWESVKDQRNTDDPVALQQAGEEILTASGSTVHSLKVVPSNAPNQRLGKDWDLGDVVTVVIDGDPAAATVTEVATSISSAGLIRTATVGDPVGFDWEARVSAKVRETADRVSNLEKLVDSAANGFVPAFADPNADRMLFWDDSAGTFAPLEPVAPLVISGTTLVSQHGRVEYGGASTFYRDVFQWSGANGTDHVVITTPIAFSSMMSQVHITGFSYENPVGGSIDLTISFYPFSGDLNFYNPDVVNRGSKEVQVRLARTAGNKVIIILTPVSNGWGYPHFNVSANIGLGAPGYQYETGWSAVNSSTLSYTGLVYVPRRGGIPAGTISAFAGATAPSGHALCDGASYTTAAQPDLFAVTGYQFGGSGANFNVPNLKGRVVVGIDAAQAEFDVRGETGGAKTVTLSTANLPQNVTVEGIPGGNLGTAGNYNRLTALGAGNYGIPITNLQPYAALNYIIKL